MKTVLFFIALFAPCMHASGRAELVANILFCQGEVASPHVAGHHAGLFPYAGATLRWAWPNGFKIGVSAFNAMSQPSSTCRLQAFVPSEFIPELAPLPRTCAVGRQDDISVYRTITPKAALLELTLPVFYSGAFNLSACLGAGVAKWQGCLLGNAVSLRDCPELYVIYGVSETAFAYSALLSMEYKLSSRFALSLYGGYMSLGKINFGRMQGFKSEASGMTLGLALGCKL
jgi:hypothetical protein